MRHHNTTGAQRRSSRRARGSSALFAIVGWTLLVGGLTDTAYAQATIRLVSPTGVDAGDCRVDPCATIQFATDIATPGDTVRVAAGTYDENVVIRTNGLTLLGAGPAVTAIRGSEFRNVIETFIETDDVARFVIEGFTITDIGVQGATGIVLGASTRFGPGEFTVRGNIIRGMTVGLELGEVTGSTLVENNLIADNRHHGIFNTGHYSVTIRNNTIAGNGWVGYREQLGIGDSVIVNNIVALNGATLTVPGHPTGIEVGSSSMYDISFNNVFGNVGGNYGRFVGSAPALPYEPSPGTGEISVDPLFRDPANGDYRLLPDSPAIDAGTSDNAPVTDLDGHVRPVDGNGDGTSAVDMGAFESDAEEPADDVPPVVSASATPSAVPPLGRFRLPFLIWGTVTDNANIDWASGTFAVTDEYGEVEPHSRFTITRSGRYAFVVWLETWRRGDDRDGRRYLITVTARDDAGNVGIASTTVTVRYDWRR